MIKLSQLLESSIVTMGLGPDSRIVTMGYGDNIHRGAGLTGRRRARRAKPFDPKEFYDGIEHWEIKTNLFGKKINYKSMIEYDEKQNIKIDMKDANVIYDDIYKVEVKSVKRREVLEESEVNDE